MIKRFYCQACNKYPSSARAEISLQIIVTAVLNKLTIEDNHRLVIPDISDIDIDKLTCPYCNRLVVVKTGNWKFVEEET